MKLLKSALSGISLLGSTNAPIASSFTVWGEVTSLFWEEGRWGYEKSGRDARMTFAKWVGTDIEGGVPITSYVTRYFPSGWSVGR
jgi:hypothetical protein